MHQIVNTCNGVIDTPDKLLSIRRTICNAVDQLLCGQVEMWELERALAGPRTVEQAQAAAAGKNVVLQEVTGEIVTNNFQRVANVVEDAVNSLNAPDIDNGILKNIAGREALLRFREILAEDVQKEMGQYAENGSVSLQGNCAVPMQPITVQALPEVTESYSGVLPSVGQPLFSEVFQEYLTKRQNGDFAFRGYGPLKDEGRRLKNGAELWVEVNGDQPISAYSNEHVKEFKKKLLQLPACYNKSEKDRSNGMNLDEYIAIADSFDEAMKKDVKNLVETGEIPESEAEILVLERESKRLGRGTINKHISAVTVVMSYFEEDKSIKTVLDKLKKIRFSKSEVKKDPKRFVRSLDDEQLYQLLTSSIFTGANSCKKYYEPGETVLRNQALFWSPILATFMNLRREESVQIKVNDVVIKEGVWCINVNPGLGQSVKNESSKRIVPIPEILIKLGFIEFYKRQKSARRVLLFPELKLGKNGCRGDIIGDKFLRMRQEIGLAQRGCDIHALRHVFCDEALKYGDYFKVMKLMGHSISGETGQTYSHKEPSIKELKKIIDKVTHGFEVIETERGPLLRPKKARIKDMDITFPEVIAH